MIMNEKELADKLLKLGDSELSSPTGPRDLTRRVLARDRRRVTALAALAAAFWLGSIVLLYRFMAELLGLYARFQEAGWPAADPHAAHVYRFLLGLAASLEAMGFALLLTMVLLFVSRRASLRQINANLIEISEKLERLEQRTAAFGDGPSGERDPH
jgi:hypothetical protein